MSTLPVICILIVIFAITMYVLLDGFDLGVGILLLTARREQVRNELVESIAPIWDGNETWLILAAIVLFGAFPLAYSVLAPAFYLPFMVMLVSLGFRGVGMEFRVHTPFPRFWDSAFCIGSTMAAFCQGLVAGALLSGTVTVTQGQFTGHTFDVFTSFNCFMGLAAVATYAMLGAGWIHWKTGNRLQQLRKPIFRAVLVIALLLIVLVCSLATTTPTVAAMWRLHPVMMMVMGGLAFGLWLIAFVSVHTGPDGRPLLFSLAAVAVLLVGFVATLWPYIVPFTLSIDAASAAPESQLIVAIGSLVLLPVIVGYNAFAYWVFRGKVGATKGI